MKRIGFLQIIIVAILSSSSLTLVAQRVNVVAKSVKETRSSEEDDNVLEVEILIKGLLVDASHLVRVKEITNVQDDQGVQLLAKETLFSSSDDFHSDSTIKLAFETPSRNASLIKNVEGVLEYFTPKIDSGGKVVVDKPFSRMNTIVVDDKTSNVKVKFTDEQTINEVKKVYKEDINMKLDSLKDEGIFGSMLGEVAEGFVNVFDGMFSGLDDFFGVEHVFYFKVDDPNENLVEINIYDEGGKLVSIGTSKYGPVHTKSFQKEPQASWTMEFIIKNQKTVKEIPFTLSNIVLP